MNRTFVTTLLVTIGAALLGTFSASAEPGKIDDIVDILHQAQTSDNPTPLLEKAKEELKKFKPDPNQAKMTVQGVGPKKRAAVNEGAHKFKDEAMKALDAAIATAKTGEKATPTTQGSTLTPPPLGTAMNTPGTTLKARIDDAIAKVHEAGELKH